jgi:hypothetical protein
VKLGRPKIASATERILRNRKRPSRLPCAME